MKVYVATVEGRMCRDVFASRSNLVSSLISELEDHYEARIVEGNVGVFIKELSDWDFGNNLYPQWTYVIHEKEVIE